MPPYAWPTYAPHNNYRASPTRRRTGSRRGRSSARCTLPKGAAGLAVGEVAVGRWPLVVHSKTATKYDWWHRCTGESRVATEGTGERARGFCVPARFGLVNAGVAATLNSIRCPPEPSCVTRPSVPEPERTDPWLEPRRPWLLCYSDCCSSCPARHPRPKPISPATGRSPSSIRRPANALHPQVREQGWQMGWHRHRQQ
jgi:hypothetical protein